MGPRQTLRYIRKVYKLDYSKESPFPINCGRFLEIPKLFSKLGLKRGAEVGVYRGRYSHDLLTKIEGLEHLTGVDAWELYKGYKDYDKIEDIQDAHREASETYKKFGDKATLIQGWSTEVAKTIPDESLDFVFIDANHAYEYVVADIAAWAPKVRRGGIVYGHDFDDYSKHHKRWVFMNVVNAVEGWVKSNKIHPWFVLLGNRNKCWMYVKV